MYYVYLYYLSSHIVEWLKLNPPSLNQFSSLFPRLWHIDRSGTCENVPSARKKYWLQRCKMLLKQNDLVLKLLNSIQKS